MPLSWRSREARFRAVAKSARTRVVSGTRLIGLAGCPFPSRIASAGLGSCVLGRLGLGFGAEDEVSFGGGVYLAGGLYPFDERSAWFHDALPFPFYPAALRAWRRKALAEAASGSISWKSALTSAAACRPRALHVPDDGLLAGGVGVNLLERQRGFGQR